MKYFVSFKNMFLLLIAILWTKIALLMTINHCQLSFHIKLWMKLFFIFQSVFFPDRSTCSKTIDEFE